MRRLTYDDWSMVSQLSKCWLSALLGDHDEVRKLQAVTLAEIFQERLDELRTRVPQLDVDDNDAGTPEIWRRRI